MRHRQLRRPQPLSAISHQPSSRDATSHYSCAASETKFASALADRRTPRSPSNNTNDLTFSPLVAPRVGRILGPRPATTHEQLSEYTRRALLRFQAPRFALGCPRLNAIEHSAVTTSTPATASTSSRRGGRGRRATGDGRRATGDGRRASRLSLCLARDFGRVDTASACSRAPVAPPSANGGFAGPEPRLATGTRTHPAQRWTRRGRDATRSPRAAAPRPVRQNRLPDTGQL